MLNTTIPLSLYIHLPWCVKKCPYCDFNSHAAPDNLPEELYVNALLNDLDHYLPLVWGRRIISIFFGGGTPSLFSANAIEKILQGVHARFNYGSDIEITLEANPGTVDESRFAAFKQAGINRLSIGVQSLQNEKLKLLGRIHDRDRALRAIDAAVASGFKNFNLDLMHGLPQQSIEEGLDDLKNILQFESPHLSWYQLTIEPNTLFHHHPPKLPDENVMWEMEEQGKKIISEKKLNQYEVSAYAKENFECVHNKNYWEFGDYLGIGAGAHSKITEREQQRIIRFSNPKHPKDYLNPMMRENISSNTLAQKDIIFEFMLNALRLTKGVSVKLFQERTGLELNLLEPMISHAREKKLLIEDKNIFCATELGKKFLNNLVGMFLI